jgi:hypothetical protein
MKCKKFSQKVSTKEELSWSDSADTFFHYLICSPCRKYFAHLKIMKENFKKVLSRNQNLDTSEFESQIVKKILERRND